MNENKQKEAGVCPLFKNKITLLADTKLHVHDGVYFEVEKFYGMDSRTAICCSQFVIGKRNLFFGERSNVSYLGSGYNGPNVGIK